MSKVAGMFDMSDDEDNEHIYENPKTNTQTSHSITKESEITTPDTKSSNINQNNNNCCVYYDGIFISTTIENNGEKSKIQDDTTNVSEKKNNNEMTPENAKAIHILQTEGSKKAVKYMFNPTGKQQLSYAEMRSRFG